MASITTTRRTMDGVTLNLLSDGSIVTGDGRILGQVSKELATIIMNDCRSSELSEIKGYIRSALDA